MPGASIMDMPVEIRLQILQLLLVHPEPLLMPGGSPDWFCYPGPISHQYPNQLSILQTCRSLYLEGAAIFYGNNSFLVGQLGVAYSYSNMLSVTTRAYVQRLTIAFDINETMESCSWNCITPFNGLTHLTFALRSRTPLYRDYNAIGSFCCLIPNLRSVELQREDWLKWRKTGGPVVLPKKVMERLRKDLEETDRTNDRLRYWTSRRDGSPSREEEELTGWSRENLAGLSRREVRYLSNHFRSRSGSCGG